MHHLHVPGMNCSGCLKAVTRAIQAADPLARVEGNLDSRSITVKSDQAGASLLKALEEAGYPAKPLSPLTE
jgi:copper chaperone